jgi:phosphoserine phosphatase
MRLALFDLDHTLIPLDSDHAWGQFTVAQGWRDAEAFGRANDAFYAQYKAGTLDIAEYIRFATEVIRELGPERAAAAHADFMREMVLPHIQPQALQLVRHHVHAPVAANPDERLLAIAQARGWRILNLFHDQEIH